MSSGQQDHEPSPSQAFPEFFDNKALEKTTRLMLEPHNYRDRVLQFGSLGDSSIVLRSKVELSSGPGPHLVPIASLARDTLVNIARIEASEGVTGIAVGRREYAVFAGALLRGLATNIEGLRIGPDIEPEVALAFQVASIERDLTAGLATVLSYLKNLDAHEIQDSSLEQIGLLAKNEPFMKLFRYFRGFRPVLVACSPVNPAFSVQFETDVGFNEAGSSVYGQIVRHVFGLTSYEFGFPAKGALRAETFHFEFQAPVGHYLRRCAVERSQVHRGRRPARAPRWDRNPYVPTAPAFLMHAHASQDGLAHVYMGDVALDSNRPRALTIRVKISERPLGQLFGSLLRWLIVFVSLLFVDSLGSKAVAAQSTLGISLLLALPGLLGISTFLLASGDSSSQRPIGPRVASFVAGLSSLVSAGFYAKWSLGYGACVSHRNQLLLAVTKGSGPTEPIQPCSRAEPSDVSAALETLKIVSAVAVVVFGLLFVINLFNFLLAGASHPREVRS